MSVASRGLRGIVAAETRKSVVDGTAGTFNLSGYNIDDIAGKVSYEEAVFLLWNEHLPNQTELATFTQQLREQRALPTAIIDFIRLCPVDADPMDTLRTAISMLGTLSNPGTSSGVSVDTVRHQALGLMSKLGGLIAATHRIRNGQDPIEPRQDLGEAAHFLYLMSGEEPGAVSAKALDLAMVLHIDHGFNNSTFTARVVISTLTDVYAAVTAAVASLKGPLHGGANAEIVPMLREIGSLKAVDDWVAGRLARKELVMGIGHPVYKTEDPRAKHLKHISLELQGEVIDAKWLQMAERIEHLMNEAKGLHGNVDLYAAPVYYSLGIPTDQFTPLFVLSRCAGWCAHIFEQLSDNRIFRPDCEYVGPPIGLQVVPLSERMK